MKIAVEEEEVVPDTSPPRAVVQAIRDSFVSAVRVTDSTRPLPKTRFGLGLANAEDVLEALRACTISTEQQEADAKLSKEAALRASKKAEERRRRKFFEAMRLEFKNKNERMHKLVDATIESLKPVAVEPPPPPPPSIGVAPAPAAPTRPTTPPTISRVSNNTPTNLPPSQPTVSATRIAPNPPSGQDYIAFSDSCIEVVKGIKKNLRPKMGSDFIKKRMIITRCIGQVTNSRSKIMSIAKQIHAALNEAKNVSEDMWWVLMDYLSKALCNESPEDALLRSGRKKNDGVFESDDKYNERMCGMVALYAAVVQTKDYVNNIYGIDFGWQWLARILNKKPRSISPMILHAFLEVAGNRLCLEYKQQATKIFHYILSVYIPQIPGDSVASSVRLELLLTENLRNNGKIPPLPGSIMDA
ncbi:Nuclear pore complex nucleoporin component [Phlyctochytrium planicorne]|nr:Nuclear pore complex nucleoporin component [Phlyctochytrium planicorne]